MATRLPESECPLCGHSYEEHDFDIHNGDLEQLGMKAGANVFPYEMYCVGCDEGWDYPVPPIGRPEHDLYMIKNLERSGHYCHIGPLPRWVETKPHSWEPVYGPWFPPARSGSTSATSSNYVVSMQVHL